MPPNRHEFEKLMTLKAEQGKKLHEAHLSLVKQAALKVDYVTKHEHWDYYLSLLQPKLDQARSEELQWLANSAEANEARDWHIAQRNYFSWKSRRETLEEAMELPGKLLAASQANDAQPA
ncbi:MAG: hypothetical protein IPJ44_20820 [Nitrospira sp.]|jgi:hypothetical protein|nr:hypothetical protein [Nitrospira sp.]